jgi:CO/xanthine dehydrogenase Mo-binding subunit
VGISRPRSDSEAKVRGATRFASDAPRPGLLHARMVLAEHAHALIKQIDTGPALAIAGVVAVLTADDLAIAPVAAMRMFEPLAREEIVFVGQPVALVVAESPAAAEDGAEAVSVTVEELPAVLDPVAALRPDSPPARLSATEPDQEADVRSLHANVGATGDADAPEDTAAPAASPNLAGRTAFSAGDVTGALAGADVVIRRAFRTAWVYQAYLEPQTATAWVEPDGELVVETSTQGSLYTREQIARMLARPVPSVRVIAAPLGGAFGAKILVVEPLAAAAAARLGRPVRLAFTRTEDFLASNPAPGCTIELEVGAKRDGTLTGLRSRIVFEAGGFTEWRIEMVAAVLIAGPYRWPAFGIEALSVATNRVGVGSYRGPGGPQPAFAIESVLDELAGALNLDPLDLRAANLAGPGEPMVDGEPWPPVAAAQCLTAAAQHPLWQRRTGLPDGEGVGLSLAYWPGAKESAAALCRLDIDGGLTIVTGSVDMTGTATAFACIAAEAFGVPVESVRVTTADTAHAPLAPMSGGSVVTYAVGAAVQRAAAQTRQKLLTAAAAELEVAAADLEIAGGSIYVTGDPEPLLSVTALAEKICGFGSPHEPVDTVGASAPPSLSPSCAAHLSHVSVDRETGQVTVLEHVVVQDVGRALNPALVEGQMRGGAVQGIGWALLEELVHDESGQLVTASFADYAVPRAAHVPPIQTVIIEVPSADGPYGAKGIGEVPVMPVAPAISNAIAAASGIRPAELPMTPARIWSLLQPAAEHGG